jgi:Tfp pilus assembly pilus retraction ATPase PilT
MKELLQIAVKQKASDLHITVGTAPVLRLNGNLKYLEGYPVLKPDTRALFEEMATTEQQGRFEKHGDVDLTESLMGFHPHSSRFGCNFPLLCRALFHNNCCRAGMAAGGLLL